MMKKITAILTVILGSAALAFGAAPANNGFASAQTVVLNGSSVGVAANNADATKEAGEPDHADNAGGKSVWFNFTPQATMNVRINVMNTNFDTLLAVYTGGSVDNLTFVGSNDNCSNTCDGASTVDLMLVGGQTYRIAVDGANYGSGAASGNFSLAILSLTAPFQDNLDSAYDLGNNFNGSIAGTNYNATAEPGEQVHLGGSPATKSVWYRWKPDGNYSVDFELTVNYKSVFSVWSSNVQNPTHAQLTRLTAESGGDGVAPFRYRQTFFAQSGKYYFISVDGAANATPNFGNFQLKFYLHRFEYSFKINHSERADIGVFRPADGVWYMLPAFSTAAYKKFGTNGDQPVPADYNGDGYTDAAVTRSENGKRFWYTSRTLVGLQFDSIQWGLASDKPVVGDFDRDGVADIGVIRQTANGLMWYIRQSSDLSLRVINWGANTDKPVLGDFDGDGMTEAAVVRNESGTLVWYILRSGFNFSGTLYSDWYAVELGASGDILTAEDFDGDRKTDVAVYRPSNGTWYIRQSATGELREDEFGISGDRPQPADYTGDGKADLAVFRPADGAWYIAKPAGVPAQNFYTVLWGASTDIPVTSLTSLTQ